MFVHVAEVVVDESMQDASLMDQLNEPGDQLQGGGGGSYAMEDVSMQEQAMEGFTYQGGEDQQLQVADDQTTMDPIALPYLVSDGQLTIIC
jgi:hypothetical protein